VAGEGRSVADAVRRRQVRSVGPEVPPVLDDDIDESGRHLGLHRFPVAQQGGGVVAGEAADASHRECAEQAAA